MGDLCQFDQDKGVLVAKYPICKDLAILMNKGSEALGCQKSQEVRQFCNKTHQLYVERIYIFRCCEQMKLLQQLYFGDSSGR